MSLRLRFSVALALLAAIAVSSAAVVAYLATAGRLRGEVDQSLRQGGAQLTRAAPAGMSALGGMSMPFGGAQMGLRHAGGLFGLVVVQYLDAAGRVTSTVGEVKLPVAALDRGLARSGGTPWLRSAMTDGATYRILTEPLAGGGAVQLARDYTGTEQVLSSLRWRYALLDLAVVIVAALAGWLFAGRMTRPLRRLAHAATQVATSGRFDVPIDTRGRDETSQVAAAFATMLGALARSREQQQQLAQDAAHELRTPLTSLRSNIDLLRRHRDVPAQARARILDDLDGELRGLTGLVDELVELATDSYDEEPAAPLALDQLTERVAARTRRRTGRHVTVSAEPCEVLGQQRSLERAVANLLDNAVKFSPEGTPVEITVRAGRVEVRDHGPGIAAEDLPRVFDRFYRSLAARSQPGSGLGLAIVRHIAEAHDGSAFASNHPAGGATVGIELPVVAAPTPSGERRQSSGGPRVQSGRA
jgi:two-component system sensor histidine kinase MprB